MVNEVSRYQVRVVNSVQEDVAAEMHRINEECEKENAKIDRYNRKAAAAEIAILALSGAMMVAGVLLKTFDIMNTWFQLLMTGVGAISFWGYILGSSVLGWRFLSKKRREPREQYSSLMDYKWFTDNKTVLALYLLLAKTDGERSVIVAVQDAEEEEGYDALEINFPAEYVDGGCEPTLDLAEGKLYIPQGI